MKSYKLIEGYKQASHVELEYCYLFSGEFSTRRAKVLGATPHVEPSDGYWTTMVNMKLSGLTHTDKQHQVAASWCMLPDGQRQR
jgi:hypothetical protein